MSIDGSMQLPENQQQLQDPNAMIQAGQDQSMQDMGQVHVSFTPPELVNIAEQLEPQELQEIASKVSQDYRRDLDSRADWEQKHAKWLELYYQTDKAKMPAWEGSSQDSVPLLTEAVNQFQSRAYKAFFPTRYFVDCIPVGQANPDARHRAERIGKHMSYQLGVLNRTYKTDKSQMFMAAALHGSDFTKTYYSPVKRQVMIERVRALDLVVPYGIGPRSIESIERKTHVKLTSLNETRVLKEAGWFIDEGKVSNMWEINADSTTTALDDAEGLSQQIGYNSANEGMCCILEQHCLLDLDDDGIGEPYIVWVDKESNKVLRIQIRYEVDGNGLPLKNKEPIEYFTHYQFLPNPDGFYGLGFGHLLGTMNQAANKLLRMFIDANELSVIGNLTYLISEQLGIPGDVFELVLGKGIKIPRAVDDINKHFTQLNFKPPSQETLQMIQELQERASRLSASSDILAGQPDKVYQPQAMLAMIEQGLQLFSSVQEFMGYSMEDELQKVFRLNAKYLQETEYFLDGDTQLQVTPQDYQDDFRVTPVFDPTYSTRSQKLAKTQAAYEFVAQNPLLAQDPEAIYLVSHDYLEALDVENLELICKKPQIPQPTRIDDQNLENTYFLMPPEKRPLFDVFADQDHIKHIQNIDKMIEWLDQAHPMDVPNPPMGDPQISKLITVLSDDQKKELIANLLRHRSLHMAYMFGQLNGVMDGQGNTMGQAGINGMATSPNDTKNIEGIMSALQSSNGLADMRDQQGGVSPGPSGNTINS